MKKMLTFALAVCVAASAAIPILRESLKTEFAEAATETVADEPIGIDRENTTLFLPESYEQYLSLNQPQDAAIGNGYVAVADGKDIYLCNREKEEYVRYTHLPESTTENVTRLQFTEDGRLFYSDSSAANLYELNADDLAALFEEGGSEVTAKVHRGIACSNFLIVGDRIFTASSSRTANTSSIYDYKLENLDSATSSHSEQVDTSVAPLIACVGNTLYCLVAPENNDTHTVNYLLYPYDITSGNFRRLAAIDFLNAQSICTHQNALYFSSADGVFRVRDFLSADYQKIMNSGNISALRSDDGKLYCIQGNAIREMNVSGEGAPFTGYEIAAASNSVNRLSGAQDCVRAGNLLITADSGNLRLSVYDFSENSYTTIPCLDEVGNRYTPTLVATDGNIIAAAASNTVFVYEKQRSGYALSYTSRPQGENIIKGIACTYGACYFITSGYGYGVAKQGFSNADLCVRDTAGLNSPLTAIASDLYGNLYVSLDNGAVYRYTEQNFTDKQAAPFGEEVLIGARLPQGYKSFRVDYEGNVYCLFENKLYQNGSPIAELKAQSFVYQANGSPPQPVSFALGFEDDSVYLQYDNYIVRTNQDALGFPSLSRISAAGSAERVFCEQSSIALTDLKVGTVVVRVNLGLLKEDDTYFATQNGYFRTSGRERAVVLDGENDFSLVAIFGADNGFTVGLVRSQDCVEAPEQSYWLEQDTSAYLTSNVNVYRFPCLLTPLAAQTLPRSGKVRVYGTVVNHLKGVNYALIEYAGEGGAVRGYVPASYLTNIAPSDESLDYLVVKLKANDKGILFVSEHGEELLVTERTEAELFLNQDGTYTAHIYRDGILYRAQVTENMIDSPTSDALRISLIVILTVLALIIIGVYVYFLPRKKKN